MPTRRYTLNALAALRTKTTPEESNEKRPRLIREFWLDPKIQEMRCEGLPDPSCKSFQSKWIENGGQITWPRSLLTRLSEWKGLSMLAKCRQALR